MEYRNDDGFVENDLSRLSIDSLEEDVKNHFKIFRGKVKEIKSPYQVPLADHMYKHEIVAKGGEVFPTYFFKARQGTKDPELSPSEGIRIVFSIIVKDQTPLVYVPYIVFRANEEGEMYSAPNGNSYPLTKSGIKEIIKAYLS
jgi:hypothetical protein